MVLINENFDQTVAPVLNNLTIRNDYIFLES